ncbi:hypothetical protein [Domibacillus mangrovi]|uniref:Uncharacterized protein n=1 Tax=Domibacillus mangrovi TaxID=1714354 RepID=A0A1Q5P3L7_9BACI|nr:hypothetical protein [Domibacillus mangrovi]OKL36850.1 hypothetical protein BLL40_09000 [Domibacillus mangrovi]
MKLSGVEKAHALFNHKVEYSFRVEANGFYDLHIEASSDSDWGKKGNESNLLLVEVIGEQDIAFKYTIVTYMGDNPYIYSLYLGFLHEGNYKVKISNKEVAVYKRTVVTIHNVTCSESKLSTRETLVYEHAPVLYGRNHFSHYDNCYTDTPLALLYSITEVQNETITIDYHYIFSHEDEGTPGQLLMAKWGRTLDIEWCYGVTLNSKTSEIIEAKYQGPHHEVRTFTGQYALNSKRPILQTRTTNGNFDHVINSEYCFSIAPEIEWNPHTDSREWFMKERPDINLIMIKEAERQLVENSAPMNQIVSPTNYLYAYCYTSSEATNNVIDFTYQLRGKNVSSSFDFHDPVYGFGSYSDTYPNFTIAFEVDEVQKCLPTMHVRLLQGEKMIINKIEFFSLREDGVLDLVYKIESPFMLTKENSIIPIGGISNE